jgi:hypothetical protein
VIIFFPTIIKNCRGMTNMDSRELLVLEHHHIPFETHTEDIEWLLSSHFLQRIIAAEMARMARWSTCECGAIIVQLASKGWCIWML